MLYNTRTDLASEANRLLDQEKLHTLSEQDISVRTETRLGFSVEAVEVKSAKCSEILGKNAGRYFTLSLDRLIERRSEVFPDAVKVLSDIIKTTIGFEPSNALVVALGNPDITPDALGSLCASNIIVTRHIKNEAPELFKNFISVSLCRTGVLGTTGIESSSHIKSICREIKPELVIAVDALAGANPSGLCRTIQITDTGISPGSGVGNSRSELSFNSLCIPVVAIGVPTVTDASAFCDDKECSSLFVTPRSIDTDVRTLGRLIGYAVNLSLHKGLTVSDVDMLIG